MVATPVVCQAMGSATKFAPLGGANVGVEEVHGAVVVARIMAPPGVGAAEARKARALEDGGLGQTQVPKKTRWCSRTR